jgi:ankyrin repeat protein
MEPILDAILKGEKAVAQLLKRTPQAASLRVGEDYLVEAIHWLYKGDTPLHLAAAALQVKAAKLLLESGAPVNAENRRRATPLHYACDPRPKSSMTWNPREQSDLIALLVHHGADLRHVDAGGASALHRAVRARSPAAVRALLRAGARVDLRLRKNGSTPLHLAVQSTGAGGTAGAKNEQLEIIELLLAHQADPGAKDGRGLSVRDWARSEDLLAALKKG